MIKITLVDDHALIRRGLRETLCSQGDMEVVGEAGDYAQWRELLRGAPSDVLVLDLSLPGRSGIEILNSLRGESNPPKVVVLSQYPEDQYGIKALKAGAMAYLNKSVEPDTMIEAVRQVAAGRKFITPEIATALMESVVEDRPSSLHDSLSEREHQTMLLIAKGERLSQMAEKLNLSPKTVSVYRARVLEKLQVTSNAEVATYAIRHKLID
ncbi:MAG: response regulator [Burkholderiaceae bacterium]